MSEVTVYCHHEDCRTQRGAKVWHWLCEECAQECADGHRRQTGHDTEIVVVNAAMTMDELQRSCQVATMMRRRRFW